MGRLITSFGGFIDEPIEFPAMLDNKIIPMQAGTANGAVTMPNDIAVAHNKEPPTKPNPSPSPA